MGGLWGWGQATPRGGGAERQLGAGLWGWGELLDTHPPPPRGVYTPHPSPTLLN